MNILKKILIVVVVIIAIPFILALFVKNDYAVEQEIVINKQGRRFLIMSNTSKIRLTSANGRQWILT